MLDVITVGTPEPRLHRLQSRRDGNTVAPTVYGRAAKALSKNHHPAWRRMFGQRQGGAEGA